MSRQAKPLHTTLRGRVITRVLIAVLALFGLGAPMCAFTWAFVTFATAHTVTGSTSFALRFHDLRIESRGADVTVEPLTAGPEAEGDAIFVDYEAVGYVSDPRIGVSEVDGTQVLSVEAVVDNARIGSTTKITVKVPEKLTAELAIDAVGSETSYWLKGSYDQLTASIDGGLVDVTGSASTLDLTTSTGRVSVEGAFSKVSATTDSGRIFLNAAVAQSAALATESGDIRADFSYDPEKDSDIFATASVPATIGSPVQPADGIEARSTSGTVDIVIPDPATVTDGLPYLFDVDAQGALGASLLPAAHPDEPHVPVKVGSASGTVEIQYP